MIYFIGNNSLLSDSRIKQSTVEECLEYFKDKEFIAVDTETKGRNPHTKATICLQIGDSSNQFVIDVRRINILKFKDLLESKTCLLHNAKFDYKFLKKAGIVLDKIYDTMLAECVLYCGYDKYGYGLKDLCLRYLGITLDKETRGDFFKITSEEFNLYQILYAAKDVEHLHQIKDLQQIRIDEYNLQYCINLENQVVKALADIEYNGMYLNAEKWKSNTNNYKEELDKIVDKLDNLIFSDAKLKKLYYSGSQGNLFGFSSRLLDINYASPKQIKDLANNLGYKLESTDDRELTKLINENEIFKTLQTYRELAKVISTYGEKFLDYIEPSTNRVHTSFWQVLTTGRVSSGGKDDNAPNLQNLPAKGVEYYEDGVKKVKYPFRNAFEARKGFKWISIDFSQQELRLMADGSGEKGFIDVLNRGEDLHCYAGSMMFRRPVTKADKDLRNKAKTINFGKISKYG